jgi:hypothetical protein
LASKKQSFSNDSVEVCIPRSKGVEVFSTTAGKKSSCRTAATNVWPINQSTTDGTPKTIANSFYFYIVII